VGAVEVDVDQIARVDRERRTLAGPVLVNTALAGAVILRQQERTFDQDLTAVSAVVALTLEKRFLLGDIFLPKSVKRESAHFSADKFELSNHKYTLSESSALALAACFV
jgi:hypothetical protein